MKECVGITRIATYMPQGIRDSHWIAQASNIPEKVIREKFGIHQVHKAGADESVADMGIKAAKKVLKDVDPETLDLVVYCGSEYKDYYLFNCGAKIQQSIGATNAASFELHVLCSSGVYALKVLKSMMLQDGELNRVLLVSSSKEGELIDYRDEESRFMFNFGDGAAAVLLEKGATKNIVLETAMISDGRFAEDVKVPGIGCKTFGNAEISYVQNHYLRVMNPHMKEALNPITWKNFIKVIEKSAQKSGYTPKDIRFLASVFMKKSISDAMVSHFGLKEENTFLLQDYGHCQSADCLSP